MTIYSLDVLLFLFGCCSMSSSNCCFLTCIQVSQEAGQVIWYPHLLQIFPQFIVIHTVKGFGIVNTAEIDVFLEHSCFFIHGIFQAIVLEWVTISFSMGSSWPRGQTCISCIAGRLFITEAPGRPYMESYWLLILPTLITKLPETIPKERVPIVFNCGKDPNLLCMLYLKLQRARELL